jgi:hypothetical protein
MLHELRIYQIFAHNREAFHARFRGHAMPLFKRCGFNFVGLWECEGEEGLEFVYLLEWPDITARKTAWDLFFADEDWKETKRRTAAEHGDLVGKTSSRLLRPTTYGA